MAADRSGIIVTMTDTETGESETAEIPVDGWIVVVAGRRFVAYENVYANGTAVITTRLMARRDDDGR